MNTNQGPLDVDDSPSTHNTKSGSLHLNLSSKHSGLDKSDFSGSSLKPTVCLGLHSKGRLPQKRFSLAGATNSKGLTKPASTVGLASLAAFRFRTRTVELQTGPQLTGGLKQSQQSPESLCAQLEQVQPGRDLKCEELLVPSSCVLDTTCEIGVETASKVSRVSEEEFDVDQHLEAFRRRQTLKFNLDLLMKRLENSRFTSRTASKCERDRE